MHTDQQRRDERSRRERSASQTSMPARLVSDDDLYLFNEGTHVRLYQKLGSRPITLECVKGN